MTAAASPSGVSAVNAQAMELNPALVSICVCTFRRPQVIDTLASIAALTPVSGWRIEVVIADNDAEPTARERVEEAKARLGLDLTYVHAPRSNISIARNACLDAARGAFCAFVDDDETLEPQWLASLLATADLTGADAVLGPARSIYGEDAPAWMRKGDFHSTYPVILKGGVIRTGYTCNVLICRTKPSIRALRFDLALGQSGGEDTDYFAALHHAGGKIAYAPDAVVTEPVAQNRLSMNWLTTRRYRFGLSHANMLLMKDRSLAQRLKLLASAGSKVAFCGAMAVLTFWDPVAWRRNFLRGALWWGVIAQVLKNRTIKLYG
jgi:succinoglycan biosynthesis protein ExoM